MGGSIVTAFAISPLVVPAPELDVDKSCRVGKPATVPRATKRLQRQLLEPLAKSYR